MTIYSQNPRITEHGKENSIRVGFINETLSTDVRIIHCQHHTLLKFGNQGTTREYYLNRIGEERYITSACIKQDICTAKMFIEKEQHTYLFRI